MTNQTFDQIKAQLRKTIQSALTRSRQATPDPDIIDMPQPPALYAQTSGTKAAGIFMAITGFVLGGITLLTFLPILLAFSFTGMSGLGLFLFGFSLVFAGAFGFLGFKGVSMAESANRFLKYQREIGDEELCNIKQLANRVGKSTNYVIKDVEKMIQKGWFCQGHLDSQKTCLMVTDHMYQEYRRLEIEKEQHRVEEEERRKRQAEKAQARKEEETRAQARDDAKTQPRSAKSRSALSPELRKVIEQGHEYVRKIRRCNDAIPGEVVSAKIDRMELLVDRIFDRVEQKPECIGDIRKLMEYYLPITIKLLETYAEMDAQPVGGENIQSAKKEIEESLDTINLAFEKLLDDMFQDDAWDVSSDISVLKTMLAQEGLGENIWNGGKENDK